ncbi:hypothetical protein [Leptospira noguchii]|uniref:Uncharacterized protein n=1 Tax=Leptospira noguchii TaxID=28182 RepID=M6VDI9_9LEPT|nr:hypothetical protein [Leptospira noguchii]EMO53116.1 hypothetical protein LEP1GSC172_3921 [Leptospira noguchii]
MLTLDCGPICGFDSETKRTIETFQSSCHQESNSNEAPGCEWDSGSITFLETDTNLFKLLKFFIPPQIYSSNLYFSFFIFNIQIQFIVDFLKTGSNEIQTLGSVRLLI